MAGLVASGDPVRVAYGHNFHFEERILSQRQAKYEEALSLPDASLAAWKDRHRSYLFHQVYLGRGQRPETFTTENAGAQVTGLAESQWIVRVENLDRALFHYGDRLSLPQLEEQLTLWRQQSSAAETQQAHSFLEHFCEHWNTVVRRDGRPSFAAFFDEVERDLAADQWANRLRDRLGLSHYHVADSSRPIPVAVVRYRVADVLAVGEEPAFAVPTVLDGELNAHYFPRLEGSPTGARWICASTKIASGWSPKCFTAVSTTRRSICTALAGSRLRYHPSAVGRPSPSCAMDTSSVCATSRTTKPSERRSRRLWMAEPDALAVPWLTRFAREPDEAIDELLRGVAEVAPLERAEPVDVLLRLFGGLGDDDARAQALDGAMARWLENRR